MTTSIASVWRFLDDEDCDGYANMAMDEALASSFVPSCSAPVFRLYGWSTPALSLGRFQDAGRALDLERCYSDNVPIVRRITGGGVIYHADELTYSLVCAPGQIPPARSIKDSFRVLTAFLLEFYRRLGLDADYACDSPLAGYRLGERMEFCFAGRESFDILINSRKIGGNAQRRGRDMIFQHGSIPVVNHVSAGQSFMRNQSAGCEEGVVSLAECGVSCERSRLRKEIAAAFSDCFQVSLERDRPSCEEFELCTRLVGNKFSTESWNLEGMTK